MSSTANSVLKEALLTQPAEVQVSEELDVALAQEVQRTRLQILQEIHKSIIGQDEVIDILLTSLFAGGHGLFIGVPGLAKTMLIATLASALNLKFSRIQFTPDLMPSDITGTDILQEEKSTGTRFFKFIRGPIFCNILLADEINRTPPKTQAALLQAMQEKQVSASGSTYQLDPPFHVFATQNPIEQEGTYSLPEAQLDRFMFSIRVGYPSHREEIEIVNRTTCAMVPEINKILEPDRILAYQSFVLRVPAAEHVVSYAVRLVRATRPEEPSAPKAITSYVKWGAGPRASQYLILGAKARAILHGRSCAAVDDVRALAASVLQHRIIINFRAEADQVDARHIVEELLQSVKD